VRGSCLKSFYGERGGTVVPQKACRRQPGLFLERLAVLGHHRGGVALHTLSAVGFDTLLASYACLDWALA